MKKICVLLGANIGQHPAYIQAAKQLGYELCKRNITLIYGGGRLGLMGILADTILKQGGQVIGIITKSLYDKEAHLNLSELIIVESMQERKKLMMQLSDGFIALPGGLGTLEEIFEIWNAAKIDIHHKPLGLLNINHYFDKLLTFINHAIEEDFLKSEALSLIKISDHHSILIDLLSNPSIVKWDTQTTVPSYLPKLGYKF